MIQKLFMNSAARKKFQSLKTSLTEATLSFSWMNLKFKKIEKKSKSDHSHAKQLGFKTNDELLAEFDIIEILTEESGSEIEDIQSSIITALTDKFDIVEQEPDGNCLFRD